ncbi:MAG: 4-hydroxythreonine-4-phosphate dehydrogenase PdxA, partial [Pyramidobacter sp.]|nr:4-hydroxythreonine-4-phosphate dehydrogenase PdxA [Pyramidobacter sp.]
MRPLIAIPMGDPAGIGPEIVLKTVADEETLRIARCIVVGSRNVIERAMDYPGSPRLEIRVVEKPEDGKYDPGVINMIDLNNVDMAQ